MNGLVAGYDTEEESGDEGQQHQQQQQQPPKRGGGLLGHSYSGDGDEEEEEEEEGEGGAAGLGPLQGPAMPPPAAAAGASPMLTTDTRSSEPWRSPLPEAADSQRAVPISPAPPPLGEGGYSAALNIEGMAVEEDEEGGGEGPLHTTYFDQLPPEPEGECPPELQQRVIDFLSAYAEAGSKMGFTDNLKQKKDFGNPELLQRVIEVFGIDQHSSNYPQQLFNPHGYAPEDYIDQIRALQRQLEMEAISGSQARMAAASAPTLPPMHPAATLPGAGGPPPLPPGAASALQRAQAAAAAMGGRATGPGGRPSKWGPGQPGHAGASAASGGGGAGAGGGGGGGPAGSEIVQGALAALQARWQQQGQGPGSRPPSQTASPQVPPHMAREGSSGGSERRSKFTDAPSSR